MKKIEISVLVFTIISNAIAIYAIIASGIGKFFLTWRELSLNYTLGIIVVAFIWYLIWTKRIKNKKVYSKLSELDTNIFLNSRVDKDLTSVMCPKCENDCYFFSKNQDEYHVLVCWSCRHIFSYAWCEKCGEVSDSITDTSRETTSWECPDCNSSYPISRHIFDNPLKTMSDKKLPGNTNMSRLAQQLQFEKKQAITSIWLLSSIGISYTLALPISKSFNKAFEISVSNSPLIIIVFVSTWYGLNIFSSALIKKIEQFNNGTP